MQEIVARALHLLATKLPIPGIIRAKLPASLKSRFWRFSSLSEATTPYQIFQSMDIEAMDEGLLGTFIRHNAHILDKVSKTMWTKSKAASYAQCKSRLMQAVEEWYRKRLGKSDDISWAEGVIRRYEKWEREKSLIEPTISEEKGEQDVVYDVIRHRRSMRYFKNKDIEEEKIKQILEAGRWAPSSGNRQACKFIVQKRTRGSYAAKEELDFKKERHRQGAVVVYIAVDGRLYPEKYAAAMDAAAAIQNMLLTAHHLGIGGCWLYLAELVTNQAKLRKKLSLEDYYYIYSAILLGYPAEVPEAPGRKPLQKIARFVGFDSKVINNDD